MHSFAFIPWVRVHGFLNQDPNFSIKDLYQLYIPWVSEAQEL